MKRIRWWRLSVPLLGAAAGVILGLAANKVPNGFWQDSAGKSTKTWLIVVAVVVGAAAAVSINGVTFVSEYRTRRREYERSVNETLALVVGAVIDALQVRYEKVVREFLSQPRTQAEVPSILRELDEGRSIPAGQLAAYFHELVKPWLRRERLNRVERFSAGSDMRESPKTTWLKGEGLIGTTWDTGWKGTLIGGPGDAWSPTLPQRAIVALSVIERGGRLVGVMSITGPEDSLPRLWETEAALAPYAAMLAKLVRHA